MGYEELIPDFDDMQEVVDSITKTRAELLSVKEQFRTRRALCIRNTLTNKEYWIGPKQPSMKYCEEVIGIIGNTPEDFEIFSNYREQIAELTERLALLDGMLKISKDKFDLYRTISANTRKAHF